MTRGTPSAVEPCPERNPRISRLEKTFEAITASAYPGSVGTSTNCSTSYVSRTAVRIGTSSGRILGTSMTCSGAGTSASKKGKMSGSCSPICGTGASRICTMGATRTRSVMCSMTCRWTALASEASSSYRLKSTGWGGGVFRTVAVQCNSLSPPALAILCPREERCNFSASAMATDIRSCRNMERGIRCRRRCAAPERGCSLRSIPQQVTQTRALLG